MWLCSLCSPCKSRVCYTVPHGGQTVNNTTKPCRFRTLPFVELQTPCDPNTVTNAEVSPNNMNGLPTTLVTGQLQQLAISSANSSETVQSPNGHTTQVTDQLQQLSISIPKEIDFPPPEQLHQVVDDGLIHLNVGGTPFDVPKAMVYGELGQMVFSKLKTDAQGRHFVNTDAELFRYVLGFQQHGNLPSQHQAEAVHKVAQDFDLNTLKTRLEDRYPSLTVNMIKKKMLETNMPKASKHISRIMSTAMDMATTPRVMNSPQGLNPLVIHVSVRTESNNVGGSRPPLAWDPRHVCQGKRAEYDDGQGLLWSLKPVDLMLGDDVPICFDPDTYIVYLTEILSSRVPTTPGVAISYPDPMSTHCVDGCGGKLYILKLKLW